MCVPCLRRNPVMEGEVVYGPAPLLEPINVALTSIQYLLEKGKEQACLTLAKELEEHMWGVSLLPRWMQRFLDCMYACFWERKISREEICLLLDRLYDKYGPVVLGMALYHFDPKEEIREGYEGFAVALEVLCHEASMDLKLIFDRLRQTELQQLPRLSLRDLMYLRFACSVVAHSGCNRGDKGIIDISQLCLRNIDLENRPGNLFNSKVRANQVLLVDILRSKYLITN